MSKAPAFPFVGIRALILEDDSWIAEDIAAALEGMGLDVIGPFAEVEAAARALREGPHPTVAVLDVRLRDADCFAFADDLSARDIPYVFHTGYDQGAIPDRHAGATFFEKPVDAAVVARSMVGLVGHGSRGSGGAPAEA